MIARERLVEQCRQAWLAELDVPPTEMPPELVYPLYRLGRALRELGVLDLEQIGADDG